MAFAVPTPAESWVILPNVTIGGQGNNTSDVKHLWLVIKRIFTNHADYSSSWLDMHGSAATAPTASSIVYSCNASSVGASDYISGLNDIVCAPGGTAHSYWAMSMPGMGANAQLLFDIAHYSSLYYSLGNAQEYGQQPSTYNYGGIYYSQDGTFASNGGIVSRRCWAAKEVQLGHRSGFAYNGGNFIGGQTGAFQGKLHCMRKTDGSATRFILCISGVPIQMFFLEKPLTPFETNAASNHTWNADDLPWWGAYEYSATATDVGVYTNWLANANRIATRCASYINPTLNTVVESRLLTLGSACYTNIWAIDANAAARNQGDNGYPPIPLYLCNNQDGYRHPLMGHIPDPYLIGSNLTNGYGPEDSTNAGYSWRKFGNFLFPWAWGVTAQLT